MAEAENAPFSLDTYTVNRFSFQRPSPDEDAKVNMFFDAQGVYSEDTGRFILSLDFEAVGDNDEKTKVTEVSMDATFSFPDKPKLEELPTYFYRNSIAIVFPYLRSFISTLTIQAQGKAFIVPIMNLSILEGVLRENTKKS